MHNGVMGERYRSSDFSKGLASGLRWILSGLRSRQICASNLRAVSPDVSLGLFVFEKPL